MNGSQEFNCECNDGFEGNRCEIALCENMVCKNGSCDAGNCICNGGYIKIEDICEETCALDPCEELIQIYFYWIKQNIRFAVIAVFNPTLLELKISILITLARKTGITGKRV